MGLGIPPPLTHSFSPAGPRDGPGCVCSEHFYKLTAQMLTAALEVGLLQFQMVQMGPQQHREVEGLA